MLINDVVFGAIDKNDLILNKYELSARIGGSINLDDYKEMIDIFNRASIYRFAYVKMPIIVESSRCFFENECVESQALSNVLQGCKEAIFFAVTAGIETDRLIAKSSIQNKAYAFILDCIGSAMIEACADHVNALITKDKNCTKRFSPGYADFPIEFQRIILNRLNAQHTVGISLSEMFLMTPMKSITAVIGVYE